MKKVQEKLELIRMPQLSFLSVVRLSIFVFISPNLKIKSHKLSVKVLNSENVFVKPQQFFSFVDMNFCLAMACD